MKKSAAQKLLDGILSLLTRKSITTNSWKYFFAGKSVLYIAETSPIIGEDGSIKGKITTFCADTLQSVEEFLINGNGELVKGDQFFTLAAKVVTEGGEYPAPIENLSGVRWEDWIQ